MEWTPAIIALTVVYFLMASITTFDMRVIQAKRRGDLPPEHPDLPKWVGFLWYIQWAAFLGLLWLNWKYALVILVVGFILKVLPVLETIGNVLMAPFRPR